jgi:hypothetical protein
MVGVFPGTGDGWGGGRHPALPQQEKRHWKGLFGCNGIEWDWHGFNPILVKFE